MGIHGRTPSLMDESGTIMAYLDGLGTMSAPQVTGNLRADIKAFAHNPDWGDAESTLSRPIAHFGGLNVFDFVRTEDREYAREKYSKQGFDYKAAMLPDAQKKARAAIEQHLVTLESLMQSDTFMTGSQYSYDDVVILPQLRTISMVPNLEWPPRLLDYFDVALEAAKVKSYSVSGLFRSYNTGPEE